jgi:hypothetical protein
MKQRGNHSLRQALGDGIEEAKDRVAGNDSRRENLLIPFTLTSANTFPNETADGSCQDCPACRREVEQQASAKGEA